MSLAELENDCKTCFPITEKKGVCSVKCQLHKSKCIQVALQSAVQLFLSVGY